MIEYFTCREIKERNLVTHPGIVCNFPAWIHIDKYLCRDVWQVEC